MVEYYKSTFNVTIDIKESSTVSAVTCEVTVRRTTVFYMLNYMQGSSGHSPHWPDGRYATFRLVGLVSHHQRLHRI